MGFPRYKWSKNKLNFQNKIFEIEEKTNKDGEQVTEVTDLGAKKLPSAEMFELDNMLEAGVDLEEVNSKVLSQKTINAETVVRKYTKKSTNTNEVNNEK